MSNMHQAALKSSGNRDVVLLGVKANGAVKGRLLVMTLEQRYRNSSDKNSEISYTFPLPLGAVLMEVEVELNGQVLKGEVSAKNAARARYEEAISEGNSSIMLERNRDGSFSLELGNLMAREECKIIIRYAQTLATEHGQVRLMLPTTIAPRYGNPITQGLLQPHKVPVTDLAAEYPFDISLTLMGDMANTNVASPSHKTSYSRNKDDLVVKLSQRGYLDRDFVLVISNLKNESDAMVCSDLYEEGQLALMAFFSPRIESLASKAMTAKVLVDCSSSMAGDSIDAARRALKEIVVGLKKEDKFSLSRFGSTVEHRSRGMWSGTPQAKASAMRWIENVHANLGGTEMAGALVTTIAIADGGQSDILLITDGEIEGIDEVIDVAKKSKHRVFVVAIGASPAEVHLRRLATATGGHCDFVAPGEAVEPAVLRMSARMRAVRATDIRVEWPQTLKLDWEQKVQNYAFENDVFNVCAFATAPDGVHELATVKLWGRIEGQDGEVLMGEAVLYSTESTTNIVARLTAYAKYLELGRVRTEVGAAPSLSTAQALAVTYKLVTDDTNFILIHERAEAEKAQEMPEAYKVPQMLAAGWGGTGSVVRSPGAQKSQILANRVASDGSNSLNALVGVGFGNRASPTVWRTKNRVLASSFDDFPDDMNFDFEIPAFLRKQAEVQEDEPILRADVRQGIDKHNPLYWVVKDQSREKRVVGLTDTFYEGITPAGLGRWMAINHASFLPTNYAELRDLGLGLAICEWLEFEIGLNQIEAQVVSMFLAVIRGLELASTRPWGLQKVTHAIQTVIHGPGTVQVEGEMADAIRQGLAGITAQTWPRAVVDFPLSALA